jgi:carbamoyltransferase
MGLKILGINYGGHDASACITNNGHLLAACEQERYDYKKHSRAFPLEAIEDCLKLSNLKMRDIDIISFGANPKLLVKERYYNLQKQFPERKKFSAKDKKKIKEFLNLEKTIRKKLNFKKKIDFNLHHLCHLYSTYCPSGFKKSLVVSYDGLGEIDTALFGIGESNRVRVIHNQNKFPNSLGLFYSAITYYLGWQHHCDEGIIMGLAPYGNADAKIKNSKKTFIEIFREIISTDNNDPLKIKIDLDWIDYHKKKIHG